ncbi:SurA N-terminal domain-containing protein [Streptomyces profundus]|uniref:SurA N-terminal domain-containing protein n=1 Tax=Streptomyces profundus TaxID=2867410 RepID=UPI001D165E27|nr:SurA N-terminal domain-containing protein [Streptomyces sp. MA3_2.13]UED85921.1 SurA N-terminal domain-containing protein [Streptomyces sp. MA3_2.13]
MKRRTSALAVSSAALLLAAPLLAGCSTGSHPGAAAVVGDERITVSSVQARVETVREAQREQPNGDQLLASSAGLTRDTVDFLVYQELLEQTAASHGVEVTTAQVQQERNLVEASLGSAEELELSAINGTVGLPLTGEEQINEVLRRQLLFQGLATRLGLPAGPEGNQLLAQALSATADEVGVEVNPRYGTWDTEQLVLADADTPWLRQDAPAEEEGLIPQPPA